MNLPSIFSDENGRRSGYAYEYQKKIAAYTGWKYEYVEGSWPELLQMLMDGEIDLMSDVSYTEERAAQMLFSSLPMGAEAYYLFVAADNTEIQSGSIVSLQGKRVGVNKNSVQETLFLELLDRYGVQAEIVELMVSQEESIEMLRRGEIATQQPCPERKNLWTGLLFSEAANGMEIQEMHIWEYGRPVSFQRHCGIR